MSRHTLACALLLVPLAALAQTPPRFVKVEEKDGKLTVPMTVTKTQLVPETITTIENGVAVTRTINRTVQVKAVENRPLTPEAGDYYTPAGEKLDPKKLGEVLKAGAVVAIADDGKPLDPEVVKKNKEVVAVLVPRVAVAAAPKVSPDEPPFVTDAAVKDGAVVIRREAPGGPQAPPPPKLTRKVVVRAASLPAPPPVEVPDTRPAVTLDPKQTQVLRLDGTVVPPADWAALLGDKAKVIVSPGGKAVPDELRAANKDVVAVIVVKGK